MLFTMARLDRVKNLTGLVEWFGRNQRLRGLVNLVVVGGIVDPDQTSDRRAPCVVASGKRTTLRATVDTFVCTSPAGPLPCSGCPLPASAALEGSLPPPCQGL